MIVYAGEDVEQEEHSSIVGGNANLYNQFGNQYDNFLENWKQPTSGPSNNTLGHIPKGC